MKSKLLFLVVVFVLSNKAFTFQIKKLTFGELSFISKLPDPKSINYPNCNFSVVLLTSENEKISVIFRGIKNNELLVASTLKKGDKLKLNLVPFKNTSSEIQQMQLSDDIEDFDLPIYFASNFSKVKSYLKKNKVNKNKVKEEKLVIKPRSRFAIKQRKKYIKKDLKALRKRYKKEGSSNWESWYDSTLDYRKEYIKSFSKKEEKWVENSFFSAGKAFHKQKEGNFVDAMVEFKDYLNKFNIDLILVRVPYKGEICADLFIEHPPENLIIDPYVLKITKELLENDLEVINITPRLIKERLNSPLTYFYNDFTESHPGEKVSLVIADEVVNRVKRYPFFKKESKKENIISEKKENQFRNRKKYKWPNGNDIYQATDDITYSAVINEQKTPFLLTDKSKSSILFVGNSFLAYPSFKKGASVPHYFKQQSNITPDVFLRSGGSGFGRLIFKNGEKYLEGKKVLVYIVHPDHFQGDVLKIPEAYKFKKDEFLEKK
ncbi:hypothetical protein LPB136_12800 [Tenacibaculum todarodis]|uniref:AlgX/AlgJ SGNH hydrolase-like domain-containing protein n=1 Tax=Tenacibaculum todarodis TaxID=1850252 RepID=A0A1L3JM38_9FLAO|nr:hypothetical protein [Tenacibaculum todarodis]APG66197.1 hypothetical protein LPB136_12800 [Tenacibaculum todarodis]